MVRPLVRLMVLDCQVWDVLNLRGDSLNEKAVTSVLSHSFGEKYVFSNFWKLQNKNEEADVQ